ncbi:MAG: Rrf2 family transcriptional regulator [Phycisphaerae bacterium]|jgi:Rrf2 family protein
MRLGKASAYAAFATMFVAEHQADGPVNGRRIAESYGLPPEYLLKILQQLVKARILRSETGRRGGFTLRKPAQRTTLLEIVEAIEGPLDGGPAVQADVDGAGQAKTRLEDMCRNIAKSTQALLRETTIQQLAEGNTPPAEDAPR